MRGTFLRCRVSGIPIQSVITPPAPTTTCTYTHHAHACTTHFCQFGPKSPSVQGRSSTKQFCWSSHVLGLNPSTMPNRAHIYIYVCLCMYMYVYVYTYTFPLIHP